VSFADVDPCCRGELRHTASEWGDLARSGFPHYTGARPRVSIWHGREDPLLKVVNLKYQLEQWTNVLGIDAEPDDVRHADGYTGLLYAGTGKTPLVETFDLPDLGHAVAIDPAANCGVAGPYASDMHICAAAWIARWFGIVR
jgi:poly(3-hydroxybutyrate) depolymerase